MSDMIRVLFKDGKSADYSKHNLDNIRNIFRDKIKKIVPVESGTSDPNGMESIAVLQATAQQLKIKGWQKMNASTLKQAIDKKLSNVNDDIL